MSESKATEKQADAKAEEMRPKFNHIHKKKTEKKQPPVVSHDEWMQARLALLQKEKNLTRMADEVAAARQAMPMEKVDDYEFDGPSGKVRLSQLFGDKKELVIYHFMFDPEWENGCNTCSLFTDGYNAYYKHITKVRASFVLVSKAPVEKMAKFVSSKGWTMPFVSSFNNTFNHDFGVEFDKKTIEARAKVFNYNSTPAFMTQTPGMSVFLRDDQGAVYHTYSCYSRGLDIVNGCYQIMDRLPYGRDGFMS